MENKNGSKLVGRRRVLQLVGVGVGVGFGAGGLLGLEGCKDKATEGGATGANTGASAGGGGALDCKSPIDDTSKGLRKTLQYKAKADVPEKNCKSCAQFVAGQYGDCGGCKLMTGPVRPEGGCLSFAPIGAAPAKSG